MAEQMRLSPAQMRVAAGQMLQAGAPDRALSLAEALLTRDANDVEALVLKAQALRDMGRARQAIPVARVAWARAEGPRARYASALVMARALSSAGHRTRAQWWLRRAADIAPDERLRRRAVRDFRYVRGRNRWATDLSFNIRPTDNANNGSIRSTSLIINEDLEFVLSPDARALSGLEISGGLNTRYRLTQGERVQNDLTLQLYHRTFRLSEEARRKAPGADGRDYAFSNLSAGFIHRGQPQGAGAPYQIALTAGRNWYGGDPLYDFARLRLTQQFALGRQSRSWVSLQREVQLGLEGRRGLKSWELGTGFSHRLAGGNQLTLALSGLRSVSADAALDYDKLSARLRLRLARPVAGMQLSFGLNAAHKDHTSRTTGPLDRRDNELSAEITALFPGLDYMGFVPTVTLEARQVDSTIGRYDTRELGLRMGIQSLF